jgi:hypothetical protein
MKREMSIAFIHLLINLLHEQKYQEQNCGGKNIQSSQTLSHFKVSTTFHIITLIHNQQNGRVAHLLQENKRLVPHSQSSIAFLT